MVTEHVFRRQELQVQIKDQLTSNDTSQNDDTTLDPILPEPGTPLLVVTPPSPTSRRGRVSVSTQHLMFPETMVGKTTGAIILLVSDSYKEYRCTNVLCQISTRIDVELWHMCSGGIIFHHLWFVSRVTCVL